MSAPLAKPVTRKGPVPMTAPDESWRAMAKASWASNAGRSGCEVSLTKTRVSPTARTVRQGQGSDAPREQTSFRAATTASAARGAPSWKRTAERSGELPAMGGILRGPAQGQRRLCGAGVGYGSEGIQHQAAGEAVGHLPGIALDFDAQGSAVMRTGTRLRAHREGEQHRANYKAPSHSTPRSAPATLVAR